MSFKLNRMIQKRPVTVSGTYRTTQSSIQTNPEKTVEY